MEIKLDRKKDYITKSDHKEQIMKYLSWKIKPFALYHDCLLYTSDAADD